MTQNSLQYTLIAYFYVVRHTSSLKSNRGCESQHHVILGMSSFLTGC